MALPTQWTWVWVNAGSWWWTGRPGMLQSMGSQRVGHDWVTELNWLEGSADIVCIPRSLALHRHLIYLFLMLTQHHFRHPSVRSKHSSNQNRPHPYTFMDFNSGGRRWAIVKTTKPFTPPPKRLAVHATKILISRMVQGRKFTGENIYQNPEYEQVNQGLWDPLQFYIDDPRCKEKSLGVAWVGWKEKQRDQLTWLMQYCRRKVIVKGLWRALCGKEYLGLYCST